MAAKSELQSTALLKGIDLKPFKDAFSLEILVSGKTGVGKSALINSLFGSQICKENDPGLEGGDMNAGTVEVSEWKVNIDNVFVTIYDSPGLQDATDNEQKYLQEMHDKCKNANLFLYCIDMTSPRFTASDKKALTLITSKFDKSFWKHCVLVMTKANSVRIPPREKGKERAYHKRLYDTFLSTFHEQLIKQGVPEEIVKAIPGVAAGYADPDYEDERYIWYVSNKVELEPDEAENQVDFLNELWLTCFDRTASKDQAKLFRVTTKLRTRPLPGMIEMEKRLQKQLEELLKEQAELRTWYEREITNMESRHRRELEVLMKECSKVKVITQRVPVSEPVCILL